MASVPSFVTHYYRAGGVPFRTLSSLSEPALQAVLMELASPQTQALSARRFGPRYMGLRRATETRLRELFEAAGGHPQRATPHYFVLGKSDWFAGLYVDAAEIRVSLSALPSPVTSFTWSDSISALGLGVPFGVQAPDPAHAGRVYRLDQLDELVSHYGLPNDVAPSQREGYAGHQDRSIDAYIEVQLWADDPVRDFLGTEATRRRPS